MNKVIIIGAGGHAQVVADILQLGGKSVPLGYLDDNPQLLGHSYLGLPVLGNMEQISAIEHDRVIVAIGDNARRKQIFESLQLRGEQLLPPFIPQQLFPLQQRSE